MVDVFEQIGREKERVDLVLMLCRFGELILFIRSSFECSRIIFGKVPRAERRLPERLFRRKYIVDDRVRAGECSVKSRNDVLSVKFTKIDANLIARSIAANADDSLITEFRGNSWILGIDIGREWLDRILIIDKIFATDDLAGVRINGDRIKPEWIGREFGDLPYQLVTVSCRVDTEFGLKVSDRSCLSGQMQQFLPAVN